jgi:hypothetical protein
MGIETNMSSYAEMSANADRVWQTARLYKAGKAAKIIATGDYAKDTTLQLLKEFGVAEEDVSFLGARTTEEEAKGMRGAFQRRGVETQSPQSAQRDVNHGIHLIHGKLLSRVERVERRKWIIEVMNLGNLRRRVDGCVGMTFRNGCKMRFFHDCCC